MRNAKRNNMRVRLINTDKLSKEQIILYKTIELLDKNPTIPLVEVTNDLTKRIEDNKAKIFTSTDDSEVSVLIDNTEELIGMTNLIKDAFTEERNTKEVSGNIH